MQVLNVQSYLSKVLKCSMKWMSHSCCHTKSQRRFATADTGQKRLRILFFGSDSFSVKSLQALHDRYRADNVTNNHRSLMDKVSLEVDGQPVDLEGSNREVKKEKLDGQTLSTSGVKGHKIEKLEVISGKQVGPVDNPVVTYAKQNSLRHHQWPPTFEDAEFDFNLGVVASFGHLIPKKLIDRFQLGMVNVHASLLPRWRGASPVVHALMHGDKRTGITLMIIEPHRFDVGDIIAQRECSIGDDEDCPSLTDRLASLGADALIECLDNLPKHLSQRRTQPQDGITLAPKVVPSMFEVRWWQCTAQSVFNQHRALAHLMPLTVRWQGTTVRLQNARPPWSAPVAGLDRYVLKDSGFVKGGGSQSDAFSRDKSGNCPANDSDSFPHVTDSASLVKDSSAPAAAGNNRLWRESDQQTAVAPAVATSVRNSSISASDTSSSVNSTSPCSPGRLFYHRRAKLLCVRCVDAWLAFKNVQCHGKRMMSAAEFHNGFLSKLPRDRWTLERIETAEDSSDKSAVHATNSNR